MSSISVVDVKSEKVNISAPAIGVIIIGAEADASDGAAVLPGFARG